jgi:hypothetical protein
VTSTVTEYSAQKYIAIHPVGLREELDSALFAMEIAAGLTTSES